MTVRDIKIEGGAVLRVGRRFACPFITPKLGGHLTDLPQAGTPTVCGVADEYMVFETARADLSVTRPTESYA